jgi:hypothetical protein
MPGDEDYSTNLEAIGRFKPGYVSWAEGETGELDVTLATNLAGEPIRFTMNESLDNIVSSATLTMLNATVGDGGIQYDGVMSEEHTEEDEAQWGTLYDGAPVEPNQLVTVTESGGGLGTCTTYWRVVGVTAYLDENDVPYYEVQLEGMGQIAIDTKFDPSLIVSDANQAIFLLAEYYDAVKASFQEDLNNDGYISGEEEEDIISTTKYIVDDKISYLTPFFNQISANGLSCGAGVEISLAPLEVVYSKGDGCWQIIVDILSQNGKFARFNRAKRLVVIDLDSESPEWSFTPGEVGEDGVGIYDQEDIDNPPLGDTDIGQFDRGLQLSYSKEGVYSQAVVEGYIGTKDEYSVWFVNEKQPDKVTVQSQAGKNILNGEIVEMAVTVDYRYMLADEEAIRKHGLRELFKTTIGARSATYDSEAVPLAVEVGMTITGSSKLGGGTSIYITALNRTTDAQQNKITTGLSGTRVSGEGGETDNMGWE